MPLYLVPAIWLPATMEIIQSNRKSTTNAVQENLYTILYHPNQILYTFSETMACLWVWATLSYMLVMPKITIEFSYCSSQPILEEYYLIPANY